MIVEHVAALPDHADKGELQKIVIPDCSQRRQITLSPKHPHRGKRQRP
jgi:hypothetical protein